MKEYNKRLTKLWLENHYPLTIVNDRYGGVYSGGEYTAWPLLFYEVPKDIEGDDIACSSFWWGDTDTSLVGRGDTPRKALNDLVKRMKKRYDSIEE